MCVSRGKKCSFFEKFGVLCFLATPVLRFALLPYYRRNAKISTLLVGWDYFFNDATGRCDLRCLFTLQRRYREHDVILYCIVSFLFLFLRLSERHNLKKKKILNVQLLILVINEYVAQILIRNLTEDNRAIRLLNKTTAVAYGLIKTYGWALKGEKKISRSPSWKFF